MKKGHIFIMVLVVFIAFVIGIYFYLLTPVQKTSEIVKFNIESGKNKVEIISDLKKAGLVRNKIATLAYVFFNSDLNLQAGDYVLDRSLGVKEIMKKFDNGETVDPRVTVNITFVEGKRFTDYAKLISNNFDIKYDDIIKKCSDKEFLNTLISKYWFLSDEILNDKIYFPLEGYLYPDTYEFYQDTSIENIIYKMLDAFGSKVEALKESVSKSKYSMHDLLTIASIIEKEALNKADREGVSQVIYKRLDLSMSLGMDVTTYYAVFKEMGDVLTKNDLNSDNAYNTRNNNFKGLPVGPICSPSLESITASLNPSDTNYIYFVADVTTGKVYFAETDAEFLKLKYQFIK